MISRLLRRFAPGQTQAAAAAGDASLAGLVRLAAQSFRILANPRRFPGLWRDGSGQYHCDYATVGKLRSYSRQLEYMSGTYGGLLTSWLHYLVGEVGPQYMPASVDPEWNARAAHLIAADLAGLAHDCRRRDPWPTWVGHLARAVARDGQLGLVYLDDGSGMIIEGERIRGVKADAMGRIVSYQVSDYDAAGTALRRDTRDIPAAVMDLLAHRTRESQVLGLPIAFSSLEDHGGIHDLWSAEIESAAEAVRPWLLLEQAGNGLPGGLGAGHLIGQASAPRTAGEASAGRTADPATPAGWVRTPNGNIMGVPKGLTAKTHQPDRPNTNVPTFTVAMLRVCTMTMLPYELAFHDPSGLSFSNARAVRKAGEAMLAAFRGAHLNGPVRRLFLGFLARHIASGELRPRDDWDALSIWWPEIAEHDRGKEREADATDLSNGTTNLKELIGETWREVMQQRAAEFGLAASLVETHNSQHPEVPIGLHNIIGDPLNAAYLAAQAQAAERKAEIADAADAADAAGDTDDAAPASTAALRSTPRPIRFRLERDGAGRVIGHEAVS